MKITRWLLKTVLTVVLISGLTIVTTGAIVNSYVQSLLASFNITLEGQSLSLGGMMKGMLGLGGGSSGADQTPEAKKSQDDAKTPEKKDTAGGFESRDTGSLTGDSAGTSADSVDQKPENSSTNDSTGTEGGSAGSGGAPDNSLPVMGQGMTGESSGGSSAAADQQAAISPDDMAKKKQNLTRAEKEQIFNILMTKLPPSEMQKISNAMEDGLTAEELQTIEASISKYLSAEEYTVLKQMLEQE